MLASQLPLPMSTRWRASLGLWGPTEVHPTFLPGQFAEPVGASHSGSDLASGTWALLTPCCNPHLTALPLAPQTPVTGTLNFLNPSSLSCSSLSHSLLATPPLLPQ